MSLLYTPEDYYTRALLLETNPLGPSGQTELLIKNESESRSKYLDIINIPIYPILLIILIVLIVVKITSEGSSRNQLPESIKLKEEENFIA